MDEIVRLNSQLESLEQDLPTSVPCPDETDLPSFQLVEKGCVGDCDIVLSSAAKPSPQLLELSELPLGLPPACETIEHDLERHLCHPEELALYGLRRSQRFLPRTIDTQSLFKTSVSPAMMTLAYHRSSSKVVQEVSLSAPGSTARTSTSLSRPHGPPGADFRGQPGNCFFWPGGMDGPKTTLTGAPELVGGEDVDFENDLLSVPPGFSAGMTFPSVTTPKSVSEPRSYASQLSELMSFDEALNPGNKGEASTDVPRPEHPQAAFSDKDKEVDSSLQSLLDMPIGARTGMSSWRAKVTSAVSQNDEWAVVVDPRDTVPDFQQRVPEMAHEYPFELDTFQKQAIVRLEEKQCVFVAAHTSAGKTVVAEYAIAMAMKHMTKAIYTSPIKALSNQKFRDFKNTFGDVGLLTGDIQINKEGACLIMTTEILRSMLYNGSDIVRDVEWVIFDEVHYINDAERGVVWEEVLIMLPDHANVILLSATIPNTKEFAGWVGRTKRKKVHVISTSKRPVPLEHFIYTGNSSKTSKERFLVVGPTGKFDEIGYKKAIEAKKAKSTSKDKFGPKGAQNFASAAQDMNIYKSLIDSLEKSEQLPVVCFTFSKKRCDENAKNLRTMDLTGSQEKSRIHTFFKQSVDKLKPADRLLPQVKRMRDLLSRGIAVHHSGILPILKEVVEMLFQEGLVKLLFATETFAMGVNMPARTVVFDAIQKHDGTNKRDLLPSEYIQMAGRAGRRGKDTTGTVIILAKQDVPSKSSLMTMMLGNATMLQSRFRLTYTMILNLMRTADFRVEDMMKRSFGEFAHQNKVPAQRLAEQSLRQQLENAPKLDCSVCTVDLAAFHADWTEAGKLEKELRAVTISCPLAVKALSVGRVVVVESLQGQRCLGVVLDNAIVKGARRLMALVLCQSSVSDRTPVRADGGGVVGGGFGVELAQDESAPTAEDAIGPQRIFAPTTCEFSIMTVQPECVVAITQQVLQQVRGDLILADDANRQIPRFAANPPCAQATTVAQQLMRLIEAYPFGPPLLDPVTDFHIRDLEHRDKLDRISRMRHRISEYCCVSCPLLQRHYTVVQHAARIEDQLHHLQFMMSEESLELLPEYKQRVAVLQELRYIDEDQSIKLKGKVAREMHNQEVLVTELLFNNKLTQLEPAEIVALLSCIVFQQKRCSEPKLIPVLTQGKKDILEVARGIAAIEARCGLDSVPDECERNLHFGLVEVVYEWARGMPFAEITEMTDVDEGTIVRCIQRLDEACKDVRNAARLYGDPVFFTKMEKASLIIKRDIVFAASLYTQ